MALGIDSDNRALSSSSGGSYDNAGGHKNGVNGNGELLLSKLNKEKKGKFFREHAGFIVKASEFSQNPDARLTPRTSQEIMNSLWEGNGDVLINPEGEPVAVLLVVPIFEEEIQDLFLEELGYSEREFKDHHLPIKLKEIAMSFVPEEFQGQGYYKKLKGRLLKAVRAQMEANENTLLVSSNSYHPAAAHTSAQAGMVPLRFSKTPLAAPILSLSPDNVTTREVPDYENIKFLASNERREFVEMLVKRMRREENVSPLEMFDVPIQFVGGDESVHLAGVREMILESDDLYSQLYSNAAEGPGPQKVYDLEQYLLDTVGESPTYKDLLINPSRVAELVERRERSFMKLEELGIETTSDNIEVLVLQQLEIDALRRVNQRLRDSQ